MAVRVCTFIRLDVGEGSAFVMVLLFDGWEGLLEGGLPRLGVANLRVPNVSLIPPLKVCVLPVRYFCFVCLVFAHAF